VDFRQIVVRRQISLKALQNNNNRFRNVVRSRFAAVFKSRSIEILSARQRFTAGKN